MRIRSGPTDEYVRDQLFAMLDTRAFAKALYAASNDDGRQERLLQLLQDDERAMEQLTLDRYSRRILTERSFLVAKAAIETRIATTRSKLARRASTNALDLPKGGAAIRKAWELEGVAWRRSVLQLVFDKILVHPANQPFKKFNPGRVELVVRSV